MCVCERERERKKESERERERERESGLPQTPTTPGDAETLLGFMRFRFRV